MNVQPLALGLVKQLKDLHRIPRQNAVAVQGEPAAVQFEAVGRPPEQRERGNAEADPLFPVLFLQHRAQNARQVADRLGHEEIVLHEPLDAASAGAVVVAQPLADDVLKVEGQPLLGAVRRVVKMASDGPEEVLRPPEIADVAGREHAAFVQLAHILDLVQILGDPEEGLKIPQPALALLDVRLQDVAGIAHPFVARVALRELLFDELGSGNGNHFVHELGFELVVKVPVAPQPAGLEQAGPNGQVRFGQTDAVVRRAGGVSDLEAHVPKHVEDEFDELLRPRRGLAGKQEHEVDVGKRRQLRPSIPPRRGNGERLSRRDVRHGMDMLDREIVDPANQLIHQVRVRENDFRAVDMLFLEPAPNLSDTPVQGRAEDLQKIVAGVRGIPDPLRLLLELANQGFAIDDRATVMDTGHGTAFFPLSI